MHQCWFLFTGKMLMNFCTKHQWIEQTPQLPTAVLNVSCETAKNKKTNLCAAFVSSVNLCRRAFSKDLQRSKVAPSEQEMLWPRSNMRISASSAALWSAYFCFSHSRFHTKQIKNSVLMITCCSPFLGIKNKSKRKLPKLYTCFHYPQSVWNNQMWTGSFSTSPEDSKCSIELA